MKEVKKEIALAKIEAILEVLGFSKKDIDVIMFTIETKMTKPEIKAKQIKQGNKKKLEKKNTGMNDIVNVLSNNPEEMYNAERISKESGVALKTVRAYMKQLRNSKKVKIVGCNINDIGPATLLYQAYRSPLKALKIVTQKEGYDSISSFVKNNKKLLGKNVTPSSFAFAIEQEGLTMYPLSLGIGVVKGYKVTELKKLVEKLYSPKEEKPKRKYTKKVKASKPKRKYTRKAKVQPVEIQVNQEVQNKQLNLFSFFRKKKSSSPDLIKF